MLSGLGCHRTFINDKDNCDYMYYDSAYCIVDFNRYPIGINTAKAFRSYHLQVQYHTIYVIPENLWQDSVGVRTQFAPVVNYFFNNLIQNPDFAHTYAEAKRIKGFCKVHFWAEETTSYFLSMDTAFTLKFEVPCKEGSYEYIYPVKWIKVPKNVF